MNTSNGLTWQPRHLQKLRQVLIQDCQMFEGMGKEKTLPSLLS
jgi:hypothetical protein